MVLVVHPEHRERLSGYVGVTDTPGLDDGPDIIALQHRKLF